MEIRPVPPMPPQQPIGTAEQNLLELTTEMIKQIEKLKEALSKEKIDPNLIRDPNHISDFASNVIALNEVSSQAKRIH
ncbi:MAG TPA: hypothetical protein VLG49_08440 [Rhabdochlamydiaceae bacterium]|nr:hypothetical protein [Rhabdochlamydiaceae bacterium]